ncbi:MAG: hypothetical protein WC400_02960 [Patescibacteria group bacterium]|jgi:hypothetical protein
MELIDLEAAIKPSWGKDTCYPPAVHLWTPEKPEIGQCAVTSLVVQDYLGGEILYDQEHNHYWNRLPNGAEVDLTRGQFPDGTVITMDEVRSRQDIFNRDSAIQANTPGRYELLKSRVEQILQSQAPT